MADKNVRLEVVTPEKSVVSEDAAIVMAPGSQGEFGVLPGHTPFLTELATGIVRYKDQSGNEKFVFVSGGFSETLPDRVTILAESAELRDDIDVDRAKAAMDRATKRLEDRTPDMDVIRAKAALQRALFRLKAIGGA